MDMPVPTGRMDAVAFGAWLKTAKKGDVAVYHTGFLASDREKPIPRNFEINIVADMAWTASESGKVALVQKKWAPELYEYRAIRTAK